MFEIWVPITIAAAFLQNLRSALQKHLKAKLSDSGAAYARFFYAWPFALVYVWGLHAIGGFELPEPNLKFFAFCALGGVSQIIFTVLLIWLFSFRSFAVGTTFSKLELVAVAVLGALVLGDTLSLEAIIAVALSVVGVIVLSAARADVTIRSLLANITGKPTLIGLGSAVFLGASSVFFRGAALALEHHEAAMAAAYALAIILIIQTILMGVYLAWCEPGEIGRIVRNWRWAGAASIAGFLGSVCWISAFAIQNVAYVRAVGQIELVFTFIATAFFFKEKVTCLEITGIVLVIAAILLILLAG